MVIEQNPFNHVLYEFQMYISTMFLNTNDQMRINLQIDSHLVHLRNLAYFFDEKKNCDIHASEYVIHCEGNLVETNRLSDIYRITNCAACHMSKERLKPDFKKKTRIVEKQAFEMLLPLIISYISSLEKDIKPKYDEYWRDVTIQKNVQNLLNQIARISGRKIDVIATVTTE